MREYSFDKLVSVISELGISKGDLVYVRGNPYDLGKVRGVDLLETPSRLYAALQRVVGKSGTIVVFTPSDKKTVEENGWNRDFSKSDPNRSGAFSEYIRLLPDSERSYCPFYSICAIGSMSSDIVGDKKDRSEYSTGKSGRIHNLTNTDCKILSFGLGAANRLFTKVAETACSVPYRYWSCNRVEVEYSNRASEMVSVYDYLLIDDVDIDYDFISKKVSDDGHVETKKLGQGIVSVCHLSSYYDSIVSMINDDKQSLLTGKCLEN